jgi:uncharacterized protein involved in exopolysaccharide biosynthesis
MFEPNDNRRKSGGNPTLLSLASDNGSARPACRLGASILDIATSRETADDAAALRHQQARLARQSRRSNPLLEELAVSKDAERAAIDGIDRDISDLMDTAERAGNSQPRRHAGSARQFDNSSEMFQPLIDPMIVFEAVSRWRFRIAALTAIGLGYGVLVALATPHTYEAYSQILVDPREVRLVGRDIAPEFLGTEAALAIVDSQLQLVGATRVLEAVVVRNKLDQDPEFNGTMASFGGLIEPLTNFLSLFSGGDGSDDRRSVAVQNLRDAVWSDRTDRTFVINIGVESLNPEKSALLANEVTSAFIGEQQQFRANSAKSATSALTGRLSELRDNVERAEIELEDYRSANGLIGPGGRLVTDDQMSAVTTQLANARAATIASKGRAEAAKSIGVDSVLASGLPQDLNSPNLVALQSQHANQAREVATLRNTLGPRHPRLSDADAALASVETEIAAELRRIVAGTQSDLRRAVENEQALAGELATLKAESVGNNEAQVRMRELQREAAAAREIYEASLLRAGETGEIEALATTNVKVISPAEAPESPSSLSRKVIVAMYGLGGFALGLALALVSAARQAFGQSRQAGGGSPDTPRGSHRRGRAHNRNSADLPARQGHKAARPASARIAAFAEPAAAIEPTATPTPEDNQMYPYPPHYPWFPQQAAPGPHMQHPAPYPQQHPQPWPWAGPPAQPAPVWSPPLAYGYPQPTPYFAAPPAYGYPMPQHPVPAAAPAVQAHTPAVEPQSQPAAAAPVVETFADRGDSEFDELRNSVREIRDVVEGLMRRRTQRRRA